MMRDETDKVKRGSRHVNKRYAAPGNAVEQHGDRHANSVARSPRPIPISQDGRFADRAKQHDTVLRGWLERVEGRFFGTPTDIEPAEAIMLAIRITNGEIIYCDEQIARLEEDELFERPLKTVYAEMPSGGYEVVEERRDAEVLTRWVQFRDNAVERMARYSKMALDVGIEERQIQLAEQQAQQLVAVITSILTDLGHDLKDIHTREVVRRRLIATSVDSTATEMNGDGVVAA